MNKFKFSVVFLLSVSAASASEEDRRLFLSILQEKAEDSPLFRYYLEQEVGVRRLANLSNRELVALCDKIAVLSNDEEDREIYISFLTSVAGRDSVFKHYVEQRGGMQILSSLTYQELIKLYENFKKLIELPRNKILDFCDENQLFRKYLRFRLNGRSFYGLRVEELEDIANFEKFFEWERGEYIDTIHSMKRDIADFNQYLAERIGSTPLSLLGIKDLENLANFDNYFGWLAKNSESVRPQAAAAAAAPRHGLESSESEDEGLRIAIERSMQEAKVPKQRDLEKRRVAEERAALMKQQDSESVRPQAAAAAAAPRHGLESSESGDENLRIAIERSMQEAEVQKQRDLEKRRVAEERAALMKQQDEEFCVMQAEDAKKFKAFEEREEARKKALRVQEVRKLEERAKLEAARLAAEVAARRPEESRSLTRDEVRAARVRRLATEPVAVATSSLRPVVQQQAAPVVTTGKSTKKSGFFDRIGRWASGNSGTLPSVPMVQSSASSQPVRQQAWAPTEPVIGFNDDKALCISDEEEERLRSVWTSVNSRRQGEGEEEEPFML